MGNTGNSKECLCNTPASYCLRVKIINSIMLPSCSIGDGKSSACARGVQNSAELQEAKSTRASSREYLGTGEADLTFIRKYQAQNICAHKNGADVSSPHAKWRNAHAKLKIYGFPTNLSNVRQLCANAISDLTSSKTEPAQKCDSHTQGSAGQFKTQRSKKTRREL
jgi:hypothetical protein